MISYTMEYRTATVFLRRFELMVNTIVVVWTCAPLDGHCWVCPNALADDADAAAAAADVDSVRGA